MHLRSRRAAFTLVELLMAAGIFGSVALAIVAFTSTSMRLIIRNLATNHSHEAVRTAGQKMLLDLHNAGSRFGLISFNGTSYTEVAPVVTADLETLSGQYVSTHTNGVRFYRAAGGPFQVTADVASSDRNVRFNFGDGGAVEYVPQIGDRLTLPLINREFQITAVPTVPSTGSPQGVVTIDDASGRRILDQDRRRLDDGRLLLSEGRLHRLRQRAAFPSELRGRGPRELPGGAQRRHFAAPFRPALPDQAERFRRTP